MQENNTNQALGFVFGLLCGSVIGAASAIILVPQSGKQTREQIKNKALEAKAATTQMASELKQHAEVKAQEFKTKADQTMGELKQNVEEKVEAFKHKAAEVAGELKEDLGEWTEKTKAVVASSFKERTAPTRN